VGVICELLNNNLLQQAQAVFAKEFLSFDTTPEGWKESSLLGLAAYLYAKVLAMQAASCDLHLSRRSISFTMEM
jgi:hypothetical protein